MELEKDDPAGDVERLIAEHPPWEHLKTGERANRALIAWEFLERSFPLLRERRRDGRLIIAEVGWNAASSEVRQYADGTRAILISSGLISLYEAVARFLLLRVRVRTATGAVVGSMVETDVAIEGVCSVIDAFARGGMTYTSIASAVPGFWRGPRWEFPDIEPIDQEQFWIATELQRGATTCLLAARVMTAEAMVLLGPWLGLRNLYAGALLAARIEKCLKGVGLTHPPVLPDPDTIHSWPWRSVGSHDAYNRLAGMAKLHDATLRVAQAVLCNGAAEIERLEPLVVDRSLDERIWARGCVAWWIAGGIRERALGQLERATLVEHVTSVIEHVPAQLLEETAAVVVDRVYLKAKTDTPADRALTVRAGEVLDDLIEALPEPARGIFGAAGGAARTV